MCHRLRHIAALGEQRRVRLHVLPFEVGAHSLLDGIVSLMWFEDLPPIAYVEGLRTGRVWELPSCVERKGALPPALPEGRAPFCL